MCAVVYVGGMGRSKGDGFEWNERLNNGGERELT
jgi:hypothetical protein